MRKFFAAAVGSMVALVGFASTANASATVELIWQATDSSRIGDPDLGQPTVVDSSEIILDVVITAGSGGVSIAGVSIDFSDAIANSKIEFVRATCVAEGGFEFCIGNGLITDTQVNSIGPLAFGAGLPGGNTARIATLTFHKIGIAVGEFVFPVGLFVGTDGIFNSAGVDIGDSTIFKSAFLVNVPEPGALAMLAMGLGGMLLAGRGRRS